MTEAKREIECAAEHFTQIRASRRHSQGTEKEQEKAKRSIQLFQEPMPQDRLQSTSECLFVLSVLLLGQKEQQSNESSKTLTRTS